MLLPLKYRKFGEDITCAKSKLEGQQVLFQNYLDIAFSYGMLVVELIIMVVPIQGFAWMI